MEHNSGVYEIINTINNHAYGGSSIDISGRWHAHISELERNIHKNSYLQRAWNKYRRDAFEFHLILPLSSDRQLVLLVEQECLNEWFGNRWSYNLSSSASGSNGFLGKIHTPETKIRMSKAHEGRKNHNFGKSQTAETRTKISRAHKGKKHSIATKLIMSKAHKGKKFSDGHKAKIGRANKGRKHTIEAKENMSKASKRWRKSNPEQANRNAIKCSKAGAHMRWHINRGIINPDCMFCIRNMENVDD